MNSEQLRTLDAGCVMQTYGRFPLALDHGEGATLYSPEGKAYIDFASGIGVNCLGYGNEKWIAAVTAQAAKLQHASNLYYTEPYIRLAETLTARTGMKRAFFANGGGEANEGMIKLCRKYSFDKYGQGRSTIITLVDSFHGRTVTTLSATKDVYLVSLDDAHIAQLQELSPYYNKAVIPADTYNMPDDAVTVAVGAVVIARDDVSEDAVYAFVSNIFENTAAIAEQHGKGAELNLDFASGVTSVPYHAGAAKYFAEKGSPQMDGTTSPGLMKCP